jgi:hypothetical protein
MMVTVRETQKIANDNNRHVSGWSPHNAPARFKWLYTTSANIKPGMPVIRGTGSGGEATATETSGGEKLGYGIAEWDELQIASCDVAYASGDLIPVIPFEGNQGLVCRNIVLIDPNQAMPTDTPLTVGASGFALGASIDKYYMAMEHYIADPGANTRVVAYISTTLTFADA